MVDKQTLNKGQFLAIVAQASEAVPILVNGQPATAAALLRNGQTGDLEIRIEGSALPVAPPAVSPAVPEVQAGSGQEAGQTALEQTDVLDLAAADESQSAGAVGAVGAAEVAHAGPPAPPVDDDSVDDAESEAL